MHVEADAKHKPLRSVRNVSDISQGSVATCSRFGRVSKGLDFFAYLLLFFVAREFWKSLSLFGKLTGTNVAPLQQCRDVSFQLEEGRLACYM